MPRLSKWKNQYIDLVNARQGMLYNLGDREVGEAERAALDSRIRSAAVIFCELGSGSGKHLVELAKRHPEALCIGFETRYKRAFRTVEKAEREGLANLLLFRTKAEQISGLFPAASLDRIYVNFPDPWDKLRWKKHRLLKAEYLEELWRLSKGGGSLLYKTDHVEYFEETLGLVRAGGLFEPVRVSRDYHAGDLADDNIFTEFELLFKSKKLPVMYLECKKIDEGVRRAV